MAVRKEGGGSTVDVISTTVKIVESASTMDQWKNYVFRFRERIPQNAALKIAMHIDHKFRIS